MLGWLDWDDELLKLVPQVQAAQTGEEVNELLHTWFGTLDAYAHDVPGAQELSVTEEMDFEASTAWAEDKAYLGEALAADLAQLAEMPMPENRTKAPVSFSPAGVPDFSRESDKPATCEDAGSRLLGVFRLWNAAEYYYPYLRLLDRDWEACLYDAIPQVLAGAAQESYDQTLSFLISQLQDPNMSLLDASTGRYLHAGRQGKYHLPAVFREAEGKLVVSEPMEGSPFLPGDVLVGLNGKTVETLAQEQKKVLSLSRGEVLLHYLYVYGLVTSFDAEEAEVVVQRGGEELTLAVKGVTSVPSSEKAPAPYELLEGDIGLIHPSQFQGVNMLYDAMDAVKNTQGLIVDLRQTPTNVFAQIYPYLLPTERSAIGFTYPFPTAPGVYRKEISYYGYHPAYLSRSPRMYAYDKPIAVLIGKNSAGPSEVSATILSANGSVALIGENSVGACGGVAGLPLPGNRMVALTVTGVHKPDGTVPQRTGITPDVYVAPTIQGIAEGQDEQMEAAVEYLQTAQ